jgi:hypothetical protein
MRVGQRHPGVEIDIDFREFDFRLGPDLQMDCDVLLELCFVRGDGLIGLRPHLRRQ